MKQQIEALSNAFNIGFDFGSNNALSGSTHDLQAALKQAIEEGLKLMASQHASTADGKLQGRIEESTKQNLSGGATSSATSRR